MKNENNGESAESISRFCKEQLHKCNVELQRLEGENKGHGIPTAEFRDKIERWNILLAYTSSTQLSTEPELVRLQSVVNELASWKCEYNPRVHPLEVESIFMLELSQLEHEEDLEGMDILMPYIQSVRTAIACEGQKFGISKKASAYRLAENALQLLLQKVTTSLSHIATSTTIDSSRSLISSSLRSNE